MLSILGIPIVFFSLINDIYTKSDSTRNLGLNTFYFANPGSMTYVIPSIVKDVSAMLVAITILRPGTPFLLGGGGGSNIFYYKLGGSVE